MAKFIEVESCNINLDTVVSIKILKSMDFFTITLLDINKVPFTFLCVEQDSVFQNLTLWIKANSIANTVAIYDNEGDLVELEHLK